MLDFAESLSTNSGRSLRVLRREDMDGAPSLFHGTLGTMASVSEVASHIWTRLGDAEPGKLHQLVYYAQAWSLVWRERPLFDSRIEAAARGPFCPELQVALTEEHGNRVRVASLLSAEDQAHVDRVLIYYGHMTAEQLREIACQESPWIVASGAESSLGISCASMHRYYAEQWKEASLDNASLREAPAFVGTVDELEQFLQSS